MSTLHLNQASPMYLVGEKIVDIHHHQSHKMPTDHWVTSGSPHNAGDNYTTNDHQKPSRRNEWMPSKMRFMKKMTNSHYGDRLRRNNTIESQDQRQQNKLQTLSTTSTSDCVRVCSDCNTTKTPLWRSGPQGPKSLCNACGIRQRKARRAIALNDGNFVRNQVATKGRKERNLVADCNLPIKKRCKVGAQVYAPHVDDTKNRQSLGINSTVHKVFVPDERDAAILLMTLSYGFIRS